VADLRGVTPPVFGTLLWNVWEWTLGQS
jgi:hypothetical protein